MPVPRMPIARPRAADSVDAPSQATEDDQTASGEIASDALSHLGAVKRGPASAHDADAGMIQDLRIAANVEKDWGIVDLQKRLRIFGIGPID